MSRFEPKAGDVVTLASNPERPVTVVSYQSDKKLYDILWLDDTGHPCALAITAAALCKVEPQEPPALPDFRLTPEWQNMQAMASQAQGYFEEIKQLKADRAQCIVEAAKVLSSLRGDSGPLEIVRGLTERYEVLKTEANEQILSLTKRVQELGG